MGWQPRLHEAVSPMPTLALCMIPALCVQLSGLQLQVMCRDFRWQGLLCPLTLYF